MGLVHHLARLPAASAHHPLALVLRPVDRLPVASVLHPAGQLPVASVLRLADRLPAALVLHPVDRLPAVLRRLNPARLGHLLVQGNLTGIPADPLRVHPARDMANPRVATARPGQLQAAMARRPRMARRTLAAVRSAAQHRSFARAVPRDPWAKSATQ